MVAGQGPALLEANFQSDRAFTIVRTTRTMCLKPTVQTERREGECVRVTEGLSSEGRVSGHSLAMQEAPMLCQNDTSSCGGRARNTRGVVRAHVCMPMTGRVSVFTWVILSSQQRRPLRGSKSRARCSAGSLRLFLLSLRGALLYYTEVRIH